MKQQLILTTLLLTLIFIGCEKDNAKPGQVQTNNDAELITTLGLSFTSADSSSQFMVQFQDIDGPGGASPILPDTISLIEGVAYDVDVIILNEAASPPENIGAEVAEEAEDHLLCFTPSILDLEVSYQDSVNGLPLGLKTTWKGLNPGTGDITIALKHQPGIKNGDCALGDTDVEVVFSFIIN
ncbi:MAG: hypothetical protein ACI9YL_000165 [Luteibaculaceae bacterium]|jgi:hypothetical protein